MLSVDYKRKMERKESATPTTVLILTASPLQAAESDAIIKFQKDNNSRMFKSRDEIIEGQGTQFSISTLAFGQFIDKANMKYYVNIDDHFSSEDDINDLVQINDSMLVRFGLSGKSWMKFLNAHNPVIDNMKFKKEDEKYCTEPLVTNDQESPTMPSLAAMKGVFGMPCNDASRSPCVVARVPNASSAGGNRSALSQSCLVVHG